ncbi:hypothetical protein Q7C36_001917 [Tachysurus vachellii]|uniref:Uncharacterized protein n=1 Tax=Tachysurus vachellii TaxID=175792 RepID=A0AA88NVA2_TACVA|nr:hypothetical protein Q7C36_001917 [Tachysurus vachellii]
MYSNLSAGGGTQQPSPNKVGVVYVSLGGRRRRRRRKNWPRLVLPHINSRVCGKEKNTHKRRALHLIYTHIQPGVQVS